MHQIRPFCHCVKEKIKSLPLNFHILFLSCLLYKLVANSLAKNYQAYSVLHCQMYKSKISRFMCRYFSLEVESVYSYS